MLHVQNKPKLVYLILGAVLILLISTTVYFQTDSNNSLSSDTKTGKENTTGTKLPKNEQAEPEPEPEQVKVLILDRSGDTALKNTVVGLQSNDGTRCIQAPCPMNEKSWSGSTDNNGFLFIPLEFMQLETTLKPEGYGFARLPYVEDTDSYTVRFTKQ